MVKYVHLLWHNEWKFSKYLISMINDRDNGFDPMQHLFVIPYKIMYDSLKGSSNIILDNSFGETKSSKLVNKYASQYEWVFLHSMCSPLEALKMKKKYLPKIIYRTWGGELVYNIESSHGIKKIAKIIVNRIYVKRVQQFKLIGLSSYTVDEIDVLESFGEVSTLKIPYPVKNSEEALIRVLNRPKKKSDTINVMVGHSGHQVNNHIPILEDLKKFKNEKIKVYVIASYGVPNYIEAIRKKGMDIFGKKFVFIDEFLQYDQYVTLLNEMDIVIFDGKNSYALGNLGILILLKKKVFLNEKGKIKKAFDIDNLPYACTSEIKNMSFDEFSKTAIYLSNNNEPKSYESRINEWKIVLNFLNE